MVSEFDGLLAQLVEQVALLITGSGVRVPHNPLM